MKAGIRVGALIVALTVLLLGMPWLAGSAYGQEAPPVTRSIDVVVLIDDSGSMATCWPWDDEPPKTEQCPSFQNPPSDPNNLRYSAARLLIQLSDNDDRVAVVRFDAQVEDVTGKGLQQVGGPANRQALIGAIKPPVDYSGRGYTRIDLGLQRATEILATRSETDRPGYILLLTDGEPAQPEGVPPQGEAVRKTMAVLQKQGIQVFPITLCNPIAGCPDRFLKATIGTVHEARTANQLLRVFSDIFAEMKPNLHVVDRRNADGDIEFFTRQAHGTRQLHIVTARGGLVALRHNGAAVTASVSLRDENISVSVVESSALPEGKWTIKTKEGAGFVVARTDTFPEVVHPPPSVPGSATAPRYFPLGKSVLLAATTVGPGGGEPLALNGKTPLQPLTPDGTLQWVELPATTTSLVLQVGLDTQPLQIRRHFRLEAREGLPVAQVFSPSSTTPCVASVPCLLQVGFEFNPGLEEVEAAVYITDESEGGKPIYTAQMTCLGTECSDEGFSPVDGHTYTVRFLVQARAGDVLFGDWAQTTLAMEPAIYVGGLPDRLNLKTQPPEGWPVTVIAGTTEDLGRLRARLSLTRVEDNTTVEDLRVVFGADIRQAGEQETTLRIEGLEDLRPGRYEGQLTFAVDKPAVSKRVRLPAPIDVFLTLDKPVARVQQMSVDFGSVPFDTSPNFRIDRTSTVDVQFGEEVFNLIPSIQESGCEGLQMTAGPPAAVGGHYQITLRLQSTGPVQPQECFGTFVLRGPTEDYEVQPQIPLSWQVVVQNVEWEILGVERNGETVKDLVLSDMGNAGERSAAILQVRYTGKPPFSLKLLGLRGRADRGEAEISGEHIAFIVGTVAAHPDLAHVYRVPVELVVRRSLPHHWLFGTWYSGKLQLGVEGLPDRRFEELSFRFRSPSWVQRHIGPRVRAFYRLWWPGVVTRPLSVLVPLALLVALWIRRQNKKVERLVSSAPQPGVSSARVVEQQSAPPPPPAPAAAGGPPPSPRPSYGRKGVRVPVPGGAVPRPGRKPGRRPGGRSAHAAPPPAPPPGLSRHKER